MKAQSIIQVLFLLSWSQHVAAVEDVLIPSPEDEQHTVAADTVKTEEQLATRGAAVQREAEASEDPMVKHEVKSMKEPEQAAIKDHEISVYGNLRLRLRGTDGDDLKLTDGGSRFGVDGHYQLFPKLKVFGRAEMGFNLLRERDALNNSKDSAPEGKEGNSFLACSACKASIAVAAFKY
jgi:hypothetical protein